MEFTFIGRKWNLIALRLSEGIVQLSTGSQQRAAQGLAEYIWDAIAGTSLDEECTLFLDWDAGLSVRQASW